MDAEQRTKSESEAVGSIVRQLGTKIMGFVPARRGSDFNTPAFGSCWCWWTLRAIKRVVQWLVDLLQRTMSSNLGSGALQSAKLNKYLPDTCSKENALKTRDIIHLQVCYGKKINYSSKYQFYVKDRSHAVSSDNITSIYITVIFITEEICWLGTRC